MTIIDLNWGSLLVALVVRSILAGFLTSQANEYFCRYPRDPRWLKIIVGIVCASDGIGVVLNTYLLWHYLINGWGNVPSLLRTHWTIISVGLPEIPIALLTQLFFVRRLYLLNGKYWALALLTVFLAVVSAGSGIALETILLTLDSFTQFGGAHVIPTLLWFIGSVVVDVLVTAPVVFHLNRSRTGFKSTDRLVTRLMIWIFNTGALTAILAIIVLATYIWNAHAFVSYAFVTLLTTCYSNSLLAFLNRRGSWDPSRNRVIDDSAYSLSNVRSLAPSALRIHVEQERSCSHDPRQPSNPDQLQSPCSTGSTKRHSSQSIQTPDSEYKLHAL